MDLIDKKRACITIEDYGKMMGDFSSKGCPRLIVDLLTKLSGQNFERLLIKKQSLLTSVQKKVLNRRTGIIEKTKPRNFEEIMKEEKVIRVIRDNMDPMLFLRYEWIFRVLSSEEDSIHDIAH